MANVNRPMTLLLVINCTHYLSRSLYSMNILDTHWSCSPALSPFSTLSLTHHGQHG